MSYLELEQVESEDQGNYIVYTYLIPDEIKDAKARAYLIPLRVVRSMKKAEKYVKETIATTGVKEILVAPMCKWLSLGDPDQEKVKAVEVEEDLKKATIRDDEKKEKLSKERLVIEEEIRKEQKAIDDPNTIESLYYDWFCAVRAKASMDAMKEELIQLEERYKNRLKNIKEKESRNPEFATKWQSVLQDRLTRRGEEEQANLIIKMSKDIKESNKLP